MTEQSKILGIIKKEVETLEEDLKQAKIDYADVELVANNWNCKTDRKIKCKEIESQIAILWKIEKYLEGIFTETLAKA